MSPLLLTFALLSQAPVAADEVPFRTISFGMNRSIKDGGAIVMRQESEFDAYRKRMGTADQKRPVIEWTKEQLVAIHAAGTGYGPSSIHVLKVKRKADGLEIEAALDQGNRPATPTPGVVPVLRREGLYTIIAVPPSKGEVTLRIVDPPASSGDRNGKPE